MVLPQGIGRRFLVFVLTLVCDSGLHAFEGVSGTYWTGQALADHVPSSRWDKEDDMDSLSELISSRRAQCCVVGGGYVGLPLACGLAGAGFNVAVLDPDETKIKLLLSGRSYIGDIQDGLIRGLSEEGLLSATTDEGILGESNVIIVCVPTPLNKTRDPDVSILVSVGEAISRNIKPGTLVVVESTVYPGFTREVFLPILSRDDRVVGRDFFLAFAPERIDPGNVRFRLDNTARVIGGTTPACLEHSKLLYEKIVDRILPMTSTDAAEMVKLLENTFRIVNIGLVNEVTLMCRKLRLDTNEIIDAAATKPFGFMPFYPGPGVGGHCIAVDPHYLAWKLRSLNYYSRFIELAGEINSSMPRHVVDLVIESLNSDGKAVRGSKILIVGVAYKAGVGDTRESPALDVLELLVERDGDVQYMDPYVPSLVVGEKTYSSVDIGTSFADYDCVVVVTNHTNIDYERLVREARRIVDTRNATRSSVSDGQDSVVRL